MTVIKRLVVGLLAVALCGLVGIGASLWHKGYRVYVVHTGSMMPTYNPGDVVVDKPLADQKLKPGQAITFDVSPTAAGVVTHRIKSIKHGIIRTKGDANRSPDAWELHRNLVEGTVMTGVPRLGYVIVFFKQKAGIAAVMTAALALVLLWGLFFPARRPEAADSLAGAVAAIP